ncbi:MAG: ABC-type transport auxiliary lipoprotein family protein [candidate division KSB1 bacterium]|nr:ABC-type transport auxiliary lipoprotein family protein [candidate division KSB1 bacterium]
MKNVFPVLLLLIFLMMACGHAPNMQYYRFQEWGPLDYDPAFSKTLIVKPFNAHPLLTQQKMLYSLEPFKLDYDHYNQWALPPAVMLTDMTVNFFRNSGLFQDVQTVAAGGGDAIILTGVLEHFEDRRRMDERYALVTLRFELYEMQGAKPFWSKTIKHRTDISGSDTEHIIKALQKAYRESVRQLAHDMIDVIP